MGLYEHKEFLNFHDVARYLHDKEIEYFNPYDDNDINRLKSVILELYNEDKVHPVFYYDGLVRNGFNLDDRLFSLRGWIYASKKMINDLFDSSKIDLNVNDYLKVCKLHTDTEDSNIGDMIENDLNNYVYMDTRRYKLDPPKIDDNGNLIPPKKRMDIVFEVLKEYGEDIKHNPALKLEDYHDRLPKIIKNDIWLNFDELLYPKTDLDKLFDITARTDNSKLLEQISELESKLKIANDTITSQMAELVIVKAKLGNLEQKSGLNQSDTVTDDDKEINTKSQNTVAKILNAVLDLAELNKNDPYSYDNPTSTNYFIYNQLVKNKTIVKQQTIGRWLELASQQVTDQ